MPNTQQIANLIADHFRDKHSNSPSAAVIQRLIETLFYASLKTEEGRGVACTVVFVDTPIGADTTYDSLRRLHRFVYVAMRSPITLTPRSLAKFSQAAPPWASCIGVRQNGDELEICGLFDQEIHYQNALNREGESRFVRPGLFQIELAGTGTLTVYDDRKLLARLSHDSLVTAFHDVFNEGPIANRLMRYVDKLERKAKSQLSDIFKRHDVTSFLVDAPKLWLQSLSQILLGIRRLRHGGAVLLIPAKPTKDLSVTFPLLYERTETTLERHLVASARWQAARTRMRRDYSDSDGSIPVALVQERRNAFNEQEDAKKGKVGCAAFISSLAGVDGLILLSGGLRVLGFGVEIKRGKDPATVLRAGNGLGSPSRLTPVSLNEFGTRHRSMMRYCDRHPGSIGFVISQDGDIRAITKTERGLIVWDNIQLQEVEAKEQSRRKRSRVRAVLRRREQIENQLPRSKSYKRVDKTRGIMQEAWFTRSGDPLKVVLQTATRDGVNEVQVFFDESGDVLLVITHREQLLRDGERRVEETTRYFECWRLIHMTTKNARFQPGAKMNMTPISDMRIDLSEVAENELRLDTFSQQAEDGIQAVLRENISSSRRTVSPRGDTDQFCFIEGTSSPDGEFALGFGLAQKIVQWQNLGGTCDIMFRREHYRVESEELEHLIRNYVVNVGTNKILGETKCHYIGTRRHYGYRACRAIWSLNNRFLIQLFEGKWATVEATIVRIDEKHGRVSALDLIEPITKHAYQFLTRKKDRAFRRFGADRFAFTISCDEISNGGVVRFEVLGQIPKSGEEDSTFSLIERFRISDSSKGVSLRFMDCRLGPRLY